MEEVLVCIMCHLTHCACVYAREEQLSSLQPPPWAWPAGACPSPSAQSGEQQCVPPLLPPHLHWPTGWPVGIVEQQDLLTLEVYSGQL